MSFYDKDRLISLCSEVGLRVEDKTTDTVVISGAGFSLFIHHLDLTCHTLIFNQASRFVPTDKQADALFIWAAGIRPTKRGYYNECGYTKVLFNSSTVPKWLERFNPTPIGEAFENNRSSSGTRKFQWYMLDVRECLRIINNDPK